MDYLIRDSFFTGVTEGIIGYDRIIKMLTVHDGELMIEEKGIYSIEKFLVSRRFMYWQVYLHKTVLCAEKMLGKIIERARQIKAVAASELFNNFLHKKYKSENAEEFLEKFCLLDDYDVFFSIKEWTNHPDKILSLLSRGLVHRNLLKVKFFTQPVSKKLLEQKTQLAKDYLSITKKQAGFLVFTGESEIKTYNHKIEHINILFKDGKVKDISEVDNALINQSLSGTVKKFYICFIKPDLT
jgi:HD superfamily phosphohydrolase